MKTHLVAVVGLIVLSLVCSIAGADPMLSADDTKKCQAVVDALLKAGFPDAKGATAYCGSLHVSATYDPNKTAPPLPSEASNTQQTGDTAAVTYGYEFDGLHFKLADGSWIIALQYHFKPGKDDKVDVSQAPEVDLTTLTSDADANPFDAETKAKKWLDTVPAADRKADAAMMGRYVPISVKLKLGPDQIAPAVVMLNRAGWTDALDLAMVAADQRSRKYWQIRPWDTTEFTFDPTGEYPQAKSDEGAWHKARTEYKDEAADVALRRAMFRWCRAQLLTLSPEDAMLTPEIAGDACKAMVDPGDPQHNLANIDLSIAGNKIPVTPAEKATLADRLQSWEARQRPPKMVVTGGNNGGQNPSIATSFVAPPPAYDPQPIDMDALVALLADDRPSRFRDFSGTRTLGDNAWRALTVLLKSDPRILAKYPIDHPWTTTERHTAATAVQAWWKVHRGEYVEKK